MCCEMAWCHRHDTIPVPQTCDISTDAGHFAAGALAGARRVLGVDLSA